jgi:hypothetical protein
MAALCPEQIATITNPALRRLKGSYCRHRNRALVTHLRECDYRSIAPMNGVLVTVPTTISMSQKSPGRSHIMLLVVLIREGAWPAFLGCSE